MYAADAILLALFLLTLTVRLWLIEQLGPGLGLEVDPSKGGAMLLSGDFCCNRGVSRGKVNTVLIAPRLSLSCDTQLPVANQLRILGGQFSRKLGARLDMHVRRALMCRRYHDVKRV